MPNVITCKLDVTLIDKARLFQGRKKNKKDCLPMYLDIVLIPSKPSNYGDERDENTHMVCQSLTKAERDAGKRGEILGNARELTGNRDRRPPPAVSDTEPPSDGDFPF